MLILHHWPLDPFSRQVRLALGEKRAAFHAEPVNVFAPPESFLALAPDGRPPVLVDQGGGGEIAIADHRAALEYLEDVAPSPPLLPGGPAERAQVRALANRIDHRFDVEVNAYILTEKLEKRLARTGAPDLSMVRRGGDNLRAALAWLQELALAHAYLAGDRFSLADVAAASHLSVLDFCDCVPWDHVPAVKDWYARVKSRPAFRPLLGDAAPGMVAPPHYADLDF